MIIRPDLNVREVNTRTIPIILIILMRIKLSIWGEGKWGNNES